MRILYKRILVAVDDTDRSFKAMQYASVFKDSELVVLYTVIPVDEEEIPDNVQITLDKISDYLKNKNINFITSIKFGKNVAGVIAQTAEEMDVDLIVLGSRRIGGTRAVIMRSVTNAVIGYTKKPILIV